MGDNGHPRFGMCSCQPLDFASFCVVAEPGIGCKGLLKLLRFLNSQYTLLNRGIPRRGGNYLSFNLPKIVAWPPGWTLVPRLTRLWIETWKNRCNYSNICMPDEASFT